MFLDEAKIRVSAGRGGNGLMHFHREKYVTRGGPDGGDGGRGGSVYLQVDRRLNTLYRFRSQRVFRAEDGAKGGTGNKTGKSGADAVIPVPAGTLVRDLPAGKLLGDLTDDGQRIRVARGGRGGRGNPHFASASRQAPRVAEKGEPGEEKELLLELRLIADIGLVGAPNAGKSTFLAAVTAAQPKIAPYPFTTIEPNLGVALLDEYQTVVLADIPGLIEGAHAGAGLGSAFLRHIQRTRVLIHLLDGAGADPLADFSQINTELALFDPDLARKPQVVAVNKMDLPDAKQRWDSLRRELSGRGVEPLAVSALARQGTREALYRAAQLLREAPLPPAADRELPVYRSGEDPSAFRILREADGAWRVEGKRIERAAEMTYWELDEAVARFQRILELIGIYRALQEAGIRQGDTVRIGRHELEWKD
ncbi:MAG: GTPase ObgE [Anaerolineales bacterium]|nr:GTPase ObgE [Anaerolineales bacterium]